MGTNDLPLDVLIRNAAEGDNSSFAILYQRTSAHLFGVAILLLKDRQSAEDVLQETYVSVWKHASSYTNMVEGRNFSAMSWLIAIVRNKSLDVLRTRGRRKEVELPQWDYESDEPQDWMEHSSPSALNLLEEAATSLQISQCIAELESGPRQSLALAYYQGLSHSEISAQMGAPIGSVKSWVRRGLM
ncbi:RNA polymerase sigma factor, partial [Rhodoferax sp.]|uniref:RNA polymerase sigma factor n=1 Tax=Rhodoferax sp. TaxID=50421 RepID=UPI0037839F24